MNHPAGQEFDPWVVPLPDFYGATELPLLRIGIPIPAWRRPAGFTVDGASGHRALARPEGDDVHDVGPRAARILKGYAEGPKQNPLAQIGAQGSYCRTPADLETWIRDLGEWPRFLKGSAHLIAAEAGVLQSAGMKRGALGGWFIIPDGLGKSGGGHLSEAFEEMAEWRCWESYEPEGASLPLTTNCGGPFYTSGPLHKLLHRYITIAGGGEWQALSNAYSQVASIAGAIPDVSAIMFTRAGPAHKWLPAFRFAPGLVYQVAEVRGLAPSSRHVYGVPTCVNETLVPYATGVKKCIQTMPEMFHGLTLDERSRGESGMTALARKAARIATEVASHWGACRILQDDISSFDKNVRGADQRDLLRCIYERMWPGLICDFWLQAQKMGVLAPPWGTGRGGFLYKRSRGGVTTSGLITTSIDGCLINFARVITSVAAATGWTVRDCERRRKMGQWAVLVWGDDTLLFLPPSFDEEKYIDASTSTGYPCKVADPPVFLMTYIAWRDGEAYSLAGRIVGNRVWPERRPPGALLRVGLPVCQLRGPRGQSERPRGLGHAEGTPRHAQRSTHPGRPGQPRERAGIRTSDQRRTGARRRRRLGPAARYANERDHQVTGPGATHARPRR